jgi:hypothetical protein
LTWVAVSLPKTMMEPFCPVYLGHAKPVSSTGTLKGSAVKEIQNANDLSHQAGVCIGMYSPSIA